MRLTMFAVIWFAALAYAPIALSADGVAANSPPACCEKKTAATACCEEKAKPCCEEKAKPCCETRAARPAGAEKPAMDCCDNKAGGKPGAMTCCGDGACEMPCCSAHAGHGAATPELSAIEMLLAMDPNVIWASPNAPAPACCAHGHDAAKR